MNIRIGAALLLGFVAILAGCAGGSAPQAVQPQPIADEDLPEWILALPEGEPPRDNDHTNQAALFLVQASSQEDPALAQPMYQQALEAAQAGIQFDPTNPQSFYQAGAAHIGLGDLVAADEMLTAAEEIYPRIIVETDFIRETEWVEAYNEGVGFMSNDRDAALAAFERAHSIFRGRPEAMIQLGALYQSAGRPQESLDVFTQAIEVIEGPRGQAEDDPVALEAQQQSLELAKFNRAQALFELERYGEAADQYQEIVDRDPSDLMAYGNLGASLVSAGETERASAVFADLLARPGLTATDYNTIAIGAYNGELYLQAADAFGRAHAALPQNRDFILNQAQSLYLQEAWEQLIDVGARLIEIDTHNRVARQFLATAFVRLDRVEEAADVVEALEALPFDLSQMQLQTVEGGYALVGALTNWNADVGSTADIRFRFFDPAGLEVNMQEVSYPLGAVEEAAGFQVDVPTEGQIIGFSYEVL